MTRPQASEATIASPASSSVTSNPPSRTGTARSIMLGSNGTVARNRCRSTLHVETLRWRIAAEPLVERHGVFVIARAPAKLVHHGGEIQPPGEIAGLQEDRV